MSPWPGWWLIMAILSPLACLFAASEYDFKHQRRLARSWRRWRDRRCTVSQSDALWLAQAMHALDCPICGRLLANHRGWR